MESSNQLLVKAERLKIVLVSRATGEPASDEEYAQLRQELVSSQLLRDKLPRFLFSCRSLDEFWQFIRPKFEHYGQRRDYLQEQFEPLLTLLELDSYDAGAIETADLFKHQFPAGLPFGRIRLPMQMTSIGLISSVFGKECDSPFSWMTSVTTLSRSAPAGKRMNKGTACD